MKYGLGVGECALRPPPRVENLSPGKTSGLSKWMMAAGGMAMRVLSGMRGERGGGGLEGERSFPGFDSGL
jgi:hypothetical protein